MIEITLRLPAEQWGETLRALVDRGQDSEPVLRRGGENSAFDQERFRRLETAGEAEQQEPEARPHRDREDTAEIRTARMEVGSRFSAPEPASYRVEAPEQAEAGRREIPPAEEKGRAEPSADRWLERWERDSRRYDSGFPLY